MENNIHSWQQSEVFIQRYQDSWCLSELKLDIDRHTDMGWLRVVGSLKSKVSSAKEPYKRDDILQKRPMISRSLLIVATPYLTSDIRMHMDICKHNTTHYNTLQHTATNWYKYLTTDIRRRWDIRLFNVAQLSWSDGAKTLNREQIESRKNAGAASVSALCVCFHYCWNMSIASINIHDVNIDINHLVAMVH